MGGFLPYHPLRFPAAPKDICHHVKALQVSLTSVLASQLPPLAFAFLINYIYESCNYLITSPLWLPLTSRIHHGPIISFKLPMNLSPTVSTVNAIVTLLSVSNVLRGQHSSN